MKEVNNRYLNLDLQFKVSVLCLPHIYARERAFTSHTLLWSSADVRFSLALSLSRSLCSTLLLPSPPAESLDILR